MTHGNDISDPHIDHVTHRRQVATEIHHLYKISNDSIKSSKKSRFKRYLGTAYSDRRTDGRTVKSCNRVHFLYLWVRNPKKRLKEKFFI